MASAEIWAYEFASPSPLAELVETLNALGPWTWELRESNAYGGYLNARPAAGVRLRIHDRAPSAATPARTFSTLLRLEPDAVLDRAAVDAQLKFLLAAAGAVELRSVPPYD